MVMIGSERKKRTFLRACFKGQTRIGKGLTNLLFALALLLLYLPLVPITASACGSCEEYHPWIHEQPAEKELTALIGTFISDFYESSLYKDKGYSHMVEMWYFEIYRPGYEEQYDIYEYILCFGIQDHGTNREKVDYYYTTMTHAEDETLYFRSEPLGPYASRNGLNNYLESFIIRKALEEDLIKEFEVETAGLASPRSGAMDWLGRPVIISAVLAFIALNVTVYKFKAHKNRRNHIN